jgi:hypothetical protein
MPDIILTVVSGEPVDISLSIPGVQGPAGQPALASGGTIGQLVTKASATDYATAWTSTISGITLSGGTVVDSALTNCTISGGSATNSALISPTISGTVTASGSVTLFESNSSIGFFGASPVVRPSGISIPSGGSTTEEVIISLSGVIIALRDLGLISE